MYVCICNSVSDKTLRASFDDGNKTVEQLQEKTGCGTCCGCCLDMVEDLVKEWGPSVPFTPQVQNLIAPIDEQPTLAVKSQIKVSEMVQAPEPVESLGRVGWTP